MVTREPETDRPTRFKLSLRCLIGYDERVKLLWLSVLVIESFLLISASRASVAEGSYPSLHPRLREASDVIVSFKEGAEWVAAFFTYKNIPTLVEKYKETGECLQGNYLWASDIILIDEISRARIEENVTYFIEAGEFEAVFRMSDRITVSRQQHRFKSRTSHHLVCNT